MKNEITSQNILFSSADFAEGVVQGVVCLNNWKSRKQKNTNSASKHTYSWFVVYFQINCEKNNEMVQKVAMDTANVKDNCWEITNSGWQAIHEQEAEGIGGGCGLIT